MNPITRKCDYNRGNVGKNILLIIDPQNDFILGNHTPTLGVSNSDKDMERLILMLQKNGKRFDEIHVSLDSHTRNHIGHIGFWKTDKEISEQEKRDKVREPINFNTFYVNKNELNKIYINNLLDGNHAKTKDPKLQSWAYQYILKMQLHEMKLSPPCIWPDHCIISDDKGIQNIETYTKGWEVYEPLRDELDKLKNKVFYHEKGTNDLVEMYSIFSAEIPFEELIENPDIENIEYIKNMYRNKIPVDEILNWHKNTPNINKNYNTEFN